MLSRWFFVVYEPRRRNRGCAIGGLIAVIPLTTAGGGVLLTKPQDGTAIVVRDLDAPTMSIALFPSVVVACVAGVLLAIAAGAFACARAQAKVRRMTDALDHMSRCGRPHRHL